MSNVSAVPFEKYTVVEMLLPAKRVILDSGPRRSILWLKNRNSKFNNKNNKYIYIYILQTVLSVKQSKPFGYLQAAQGLQQREFFMSDLQLATSA